MTEQLAAGLGLRVVVTDVESGTVVEDRVVKDDWYLLCHGNRYLKSSQMWGSTAQLNIAVDKGNKQ